MVLWVLRALFIVLISAVAFSVGGEPGAAAGLGQWRVYLMVGAICIMVAIIAVDVFIPRKSLAALSGVFLGLVVDGRGLRSGLVMDLVIQAYAGRIRAGRYRGHGLIVDLS